MLLVILRNIVTHAILNLGRIMNIDLNKICGSVASTANHVGHQIGQYVDAHASGGLLVCMSET